MNEIAICLPKGDNMKAINEVLMNSGFPIEGYNKENRSYRPVVDLPGIRAKIFNEKDIPIQIAVGNYSLGFCSLDRVKEYSAKFNQTDLKIQKKLGFGQKNIYACCSAKDQDLTLEGLANSSDRIRIVSEYAKQAERFALESHFKRFTVLPVHGNIEVYPPEHAEVVILAAKDEAELQILGLRPLKCLYTSEICLVMNQKHYESETLYSVLRYF